MGATGVALPLAAARLGAWSSAPARVGHGLALARFGVAAWRA
jgi:hypothetical protein